MAIPYKPGKEARLIFRGVVLNDLVTPLSAANPYRYRVRTFGGWKSTADAELPAEPNTGRHGEKSRPGFRRGKTITLEGTTEAITLAYLRQAEDLLTAAMWDTFYGDLLYAEAYPWGAVTADGVPVDNDYWSVMAKPVALDGPEQQTASPTSSETSGFERTFVATFRLSDPRFKYSVTSTQSTAGLQNVTGGIVPPITPPIFLPSLAGGSASGAIQNDGSAPADPLLRVVGPVTDPYAYNDTLQRFLSFEGLSLASGQWLDVDFDTRSVLLESQADYRKYQRGDWWDRGIDGLAPGPNQIRLAGSTIGQGAHIDVIFQPSRY